MNKRYNIHDDTFKNYICKDKDLTKDSVFLDDDIECVLM